METPFPRNDTSACAETVRSTIKVAGNGDGAGHSGSRAAKAPTVVLPSSVDRIRASPRRAPGIQPGLGLLDGHVVGQGPPEPLGGHVVGLPHDALAVAAPRRTGSNRDAVELGDARERGADLPGARG